MQTACGCTRNLLLPAMSTPARAHTSQPLPDNGPPFTESGYGRVAEHPECIVRRWPARLSLL